MKEKPKKHQSGTKKTIGKHEKKLVTGQTEVMDFDLEEEIRIREEQKAARKAARKAAADIEEKGSEAKIESGRNVSDQAVKEEAVPDTQEGLNRTWDKMPEKEVAIGEETMELLGLDSLLDEVYPEAETDFYEDDTVSAGQDYMDFVPKKMNGSKKTAKKAAVKTASVKTASVKTASVKTASSKPAAAAKPAKNSGWQEQKESYYFYKENGELHKGWLELNGVWYHLDDETGERTDGWMKDGKVWYWLDPEDGEMADSGLAEIDGAPYFFHEWGGMASNWWYEAEDGSWRFFTGSGAMAVSRWVFWKGSWYYCGADGVMLTDTITPDGYYVDANGVWVK